MYIVIDWLFISFHNDNYSLYIYLWEFSVDADSRGLVLPTPLQVYSDEEGVRVELLMASQETLMVHKHPGSYLTEDVSPIQEVCYLVWCGIDGKKVKVNLVPKFTDLNYEVGSHW